MGLEQFVKSASEAGLATASDGNRVERVSRERVMGVINPVGLIL